MVWISSSVLRMIIWSSLFWKKYLPEYDVMCIYLNNIGTYFLADSVLFVLYGLLHSINVDNY